VVTLDPDTYALLRRYMDQRGVPVDTAVNDAVRAGLTAPVADRPATPYRTPVARMGVPAAALDQALQLAGELEDQVEAG
jgi:hypothetical protein